MPVIRYILLLIISLGTVVISSAQTSPAPTRNTFYKHNTFWSRAIFTDTISKKVRWESFYQYRTQNKKKGDLNIFDAFQLQSVWLWIHYNPSEKLRLSVTPFCYFQTGPLYGKESDFGRRNVDEFRWAVRIENSTKYKYFTYSSRIGMEYRLRDLIQNGKYISNWRGRLMNRLNIPIKSKCFEKHPFNVLAYSELLFQFGKAMESSPNIFDQNRLFVGFNYELVKNIRLELGYLNVIQQRGTGNEFDLQNVLWATITFYYFLSQFLKKNHQ